MKSLTTGAPVCHNALTMKVHTKTYGRRYAFQFLYSRDVALLHQFPQNLKRELEEFDALYPSITERVEERRKGVLSFGKGLISDLVEHFAHISELLRPLCKKDNFESLGEVEKKLLMMGGVELLYRPEVPRAISINEYINLAKEFGSETTPALVNGILDNLAKGRTRL